MGQKRDLTKAHQAGALSPEQDLTLTDLRRVRESESEMQSGGRSGRFRSAVVIQ